MYLYQTWRSQELYVDNKDIVGSSRLNPSATIGLRLRDFYSIGKLVSRLHCVNMLQTTVYLLSVCCLVLKVGKAEEGEHKYNSHGKNVAGLPGKHNSFLWFYNISKN